MGYRHLVVLGLGIRIMRKFSQAVLAVFVLLLLIAQAQLVEDSETIDPKITHYIGETGGR